MEKQPNNKCCEDCAYNTKRGIICLNHYCPCHKVEQPKEKWETAFEDIFADFPTSGHWYNQVKKFIELTITQRDNELVEKIDGLNKGLMAQEYNNALEDVINLIKER